MDTIQEVDFEQRVKQSKKVVLVDFFAVWCGPCKMLGPILEDVYSQLDQEKFDIVKVNIDECEDLARNFGVMSVPTMIVFKNGEEVDRMVGLRQKTQILDALNSKI